MHCNQTTIFYSTNRPDYPYTNEKPLRNYRRNSNLNFDNHSKICHVAVEMDTLYIKGRQSPSRPFCPKTYLFCTTSSRA